MPVCTQANMSSETTGQYLPMPVELIFTVHQLAAACKRCKGIVFTDKDGNLINNNNNPDLTQK